MTPILSFLSYLWSRPRLLFPVVAGLGLGAGLLVGRCGAKPVAKTTETTTSVATSVGTSSSHSGAIEVKSDDVVKVKKSKTTTTKRDGTTIVREEEESSHRDFDATSVSSADSASRVETRTEVKIVRVTEPAHVALLGVTLGAEWSKVTPAPSRLKLGADVPAGKVVGVPMRLGVEVVATPEDVAKRRIESLGVTVRGEFF